MPGPILRFVSDIASSPAVRLELNDWTNWAMESGTNFGVPPLKRSVSSSMLRDGEYVGADAYGNRELNLVLRIASSSANTAATELQKFVREMDRAVNLIQYSPGGATNSVFFRTFRSPLNTYQFDPSRKQVTASILAEPFAVGLRQDITGVAVSNNPANAQGCFLDLTAIKGDVETPLLIETTQGATYYQRGLAMGVRPKLGSLPYPTIFRQAESLTIGASSSVIADAMFSGGSKVRTTGDGAEPLTRVSGKFPQSAEPAGAECLGSYRVWIRCRRDQTNGTSTHTVRAAMSLEAGARIIYNAGVAPPPAAGINAMMLDLGVVSIGQSFPKSPGYDTAGYRAETLPTLLIQEVNHAAPNGHLDIDYVLLVPTDYRYGSWATVPTTADASARAVIDSLNEVTYGGKATTGSTPGVFGEVPPAGFAGSYPWVMPGDNRLVMVEWGWPHDLTRNHTVTCRYWPRYLLVRPVST